MSKHTPGRWMISAERYRYIHVYAHGGGIAHLDTVDGEGMANANLIAAAPELLEALEALLALNENYSAFGGEIHRDRIDRAWDNARAVLKKARGEK